MMVYKDIISLTNYWVIREKHFFSTKNIMYVSLQKRRINEDIALQKRQNTLQFD